VLQVAPDSGPSAAPMSPNTTATAAIKVRRHERYSTSQAYANDGAQAALR